MIEFSHITTRGGDRGESSLYNGSRLRKDDLVFEALGDVDELSSFMGVARAHLKDGKKTERQTSSIIKAIQRNLIRLNGQVATPKRDKLYETLDLITQKDVLRIEKIERKIMKKTEMPNLFILPGSTVGGAHVDVARAVCRRAERRLVACVRERQMAHLAPCQNYLHRLSELLYVLARYVDAS